MGSRAPTTELQNMKLVIDSPDGPIEIPLKGHLIVRNSSPPLEAPAGAGAGAGGDTEEQNAVLDSGNLKDMRGWLTTVAALFVGMAFQAGTQPPSWMPSPKVSLAAFFGSKEYDGSVTWDQARNALAYLFTSMVCFSIALTLVVVLPLIDDSTAARRIRHMTSMLVVLAFAVAINFACGVSDDGLVVSLVLVVMAVYASAAAMLWSNRFRGLVKGLGPPLPWSIESHRRQPDQLPLDSSLENRSLLESTGQESLA